MRIFIYRTLIDCQRYCCGLRFASASQRRALCHETLESTGAYTVGQLPRGRD